MMTPTKDCAGAPAGVKQQKCLPCAIPPFERNAYYTGKMLTARDLTAEQRYFRDKLRLHYVALHGWGVVCGLHVKPHPYCPELKIVVEEGFAVDPCGREIRILEDVTVDLPPAPKKPHHEEHHHHEDRDEECEGREHEEHEEHEHHEHPHHVRLYVCLRYAECETEFMPAPFDECGCNEDGDKPGRILERYFIEITDRKPDWVKAEEECGCDEDCEELYERGRAKCVQPDAGRCILLAVIHRYEPGLAVTEEQIDNRACRPRLRSTQALDDLIGCLVRKFPSRCLTHICGMNWVHGAEYHCHDFMRRYIGRPDERAGFEIEFDGRVFSEGIHSRSFQALVVWHPPDPNEPRRMEIAPARVVHHSTRCVLEIDSEYAHHHLHEREFDLYITLRCDVVLDENGMAVDGDLLARLEQDEQGRPRYGVMPPTGDGVPGGLFESWIRVRMRIAAA